jgi:predicted 2-oxoglutarate/Fe(II)-dependent dioxygenase YbiX
LGARLSAEGFFTTEKDIVMSAATLQLRELAPQVKLVEGFLTSDECADLIALSEARGYEAATIETARGAQRVETVRNNDRVIFDDPDLAQRLFQRAEPFVEPALGQGRAVGLNERFRFYRYTPGQKFDWHRDGMFVRSPQEASGWTFLIYLSQDCEGGATSFRGEHATQNAPPALSVTPRTGALLLFRHRLLHRGDPVTAGVKYAIRSDVMYRAQA